MADDPWAAFRPAAPKDLPLVPATGDDPWAKFRASSADRLIAPPVPLGQVPADVGKSAGIGTVKGVIDIAGMGGDIRELVTHVSEKFDVSPRVALQILHSVPGLGAMIEQGPSSKDLTGMLEGQTGPLYEPKTVPGEYAQTFGRFLPAAAAGPGGVARRVLMQGAVPAAASEAAGQATKGTDIEPLARVGGALAGPTAMRVAGAVAAPVSSRIAPEWFTNQKIAEALRRGGMTPEQVSAELANARAEGQPGYAVADALGNSGQRLLSGVARQPHDERQALAEFLDARQAGQGRRVSNILSEGFNAPDTAAQRTAALTAERGATAEQNYGAARAGANPVDVTPAIEQADRFLSPGATRLMRPGTNIADDSIEAAVRRARGYLTDGRSQISDFDSGFRAKQEIDNIIARATPNQQRVLIPIQRTLDNQLAAASPEYANARDVFREQSRNIEAVGEGTAAARRGRSENTIPAFQAMNPGEQSAFRAGYVDPLIEQAQGSAVGVNKVRPLLNDATAAEFPAFAAPGRDEGLLRQLGREQHMFETRGAATGGSRTADNLADQADVTHLGASGLRSLLSGDFTHAAGHALARIMAEASGTSPRVAERLARVLIETDPARFRGVANAVTRQTATDVPTLARLLARSEIAGTAPANSAP